MIIDKIKKRQSIPSSKKANVDIPVGKWTKCEKCKNIIYKEELRDNLSICPNCGNYFKLHINKRLEQILDKNSYKRFDYDLETTNPLELDGYIHKIEMLRQKTNILEAVSIGTGRINGEELVICVMDSGFLMGSMGTVVGEKITYAMEQAIKLKLPIVIFTASGGARMQEGILSLMQMAKTTEAVSKLNDAGILYISVLTDPTYGGVTASFASLGDIILAEPNARIGFAGRKVIEQTIGNKLPDDFQTSEFLLEHGFIDKIVERRDLRDTLYNIIKFHKKEA
ncbi:MAG: acetyl-CoA carboxylase, carboxyltransferase subunit beta [Clostridia bacterium]|nr:acetyl-CoA carboxylase, carboxyltransferase subunit beta [Clostridia bacterium]